MTAPSRKRVLTVVFEWFLHVFLSSTQYLVQEILAGELLCDSSYSARRLIIVRERRANASIKQML